MVLAVPVTWGVVEQHHVLLAAVPSRLESFSPYVIQFALRATYVKKILHTQTV